MRAEAVASDVKHRVGRSATRLVRAPISRNVGGAIALQGALLLTGTLSARMLGPTDRGYLAILTIWPSTVTQLGAAGVSLAVTYFLASGQLNGRDAAIIVRRPAALQTFGLTAVNAVIVITYTIVTDAPILHAALLSLVLVPATLASEYGIAFALGLRRHGFASAARVVGPVLAAGLLTYLFVAGEQSLVAVTAVLAATAALAGAINLRMGLRLSQRSHAPSPLFLTATVPDARRQVLAFGRRGYFGYLAPTDSFRIDQIIVGLILSPHVLGLYVVGAAFTTFPRLVALNIGLSATAEVANRPARAQQQPVVRRALLVTSGILTAVCLALAGLVTVLIPLLFGTEFSSSVPVAQLLLVASLLLSIKRVAVDLLRGAGEATVGTRAEGVTLVVFLATGPFAALTLGGTGVAGALALSTTCGSLVLVRQLHLLGFLPWSR